MAFFKLAAAVAAPVFNVPAFVLTNGSMTNSLLTASMACELSVYCCKKKSNTDNAVSLFALISSNDFCSASDNFANGLLAISGSNFAAAFAAAPATAKSNSDNANGASDNCFRTSSLFFNKSSTIFFCDGTKPEYISCAATFPAATELANSK